MRQRSQSQFYLEQLQGDWLSDSRPYQYYLCFAIGLLSFLIMILANVILFDRNLWAGLRVASLDAVIAIPFIWLIERDMHRNTPFFGKEKRFPFCGLNKGTSHFTEGGKRSKGHLGLVTSFVQPLGNTMVFAGLSGLLDGWLVESINSFYTWDHGLFYATFYMVLGTLNPSIRPAERLAWSWKSARHHAGSSLLLGGSVGFILGLSNVIQLSNAPHTALSTAAFLATLFFGLSLGFTIGGVITLMRGFSSTTLHDEEKIKPNQGIRNSLSNSTRLGLWSGLAFGLVVYLFYLLGFHFKVGYLGLDKRFPLHSELIYGINDGLTVAYLYWLRNGGFACVQHLMLRVCLWQTKCMPWKYHRFLDYAHERVLLRKVGGGYTFIHKLLLEYFANLDREGSIDE